MIEWTLDVQPIIKTFFVCYALDDADIIYPEIAWLHEQGLNLWYDEGISAGNNWRAAIGDALLNAAHVLFYISERSLKSDHCNREINLALDEGKGDVVPVYLEDVELTSDLKVGLHRVHALHRDRDSAYRQHLVNALGQSTTIVEPSERQRSRLPERVGMMIAFVLAMGLVWWFWQQTNELQAPGTVTDVTTLPFVDLPALYNRPIIAVLEFRDLSDNPSSKYFLAGRGNPARLGILA